ADPALKRGRLDGHAFLLREHHANEIRRARQTAGVRREESVGAPLHRREDCIRGGGGREGEILRDGGAAAPAAYSGTADRTGSGGRLPDTQPALHPTVPVVRASGRGAHRPPRDPASDGWLLDTPPRNRHACLASRASSRD